MKSRKGQYQRGPREFRVMVFREDREGREPRWSAYTMWATPEFSGYVGTFVVTAPNGEEAKKQAIARAKESEAGK